MSIKDKLVAWVDGFKKKNEIEPEKPKFHEYKEHVKSKLIFKPGKYDMKVKEMFNIIDEAVEYSVLKEEPNPIRDTVPIAYRNGNSHIVRIGDLEFRGHSKHFSIKEISMNKILAVGGDWYFGNAYREILEAFKQKFGSWTSPKYREITQAMSGYMIWLQDGEHIVGIVEQLRDIQEETNRRKEIVKFRKEQEEKRKQREAEETRQSLEEKYAAKRA